VDPLKHGSLTSRPAPNQVELWGKVLLTVQADLLQCVNALGNADFPGEVDGAGARAIRSHKGWQSFAGFGIRLHFKTFHELPSLTTS
jgi:hypothetical protein